ncbi:MAG: pyridine nucleotide-disulfide oxidoreductase [Deltaproteobacteria bacterium]|nr:MAG: pyridine nucleotide-disulfide oxidoreductase [Deltaproteobacteria bacterium]
MRFVIVGGDAAGMSAASRFRRHASDSEVIVLEKSSDVSYSACGMPYNISDPARELDDLVVRPARVFREKQGIDLRTGHRVEQVDRERKTVSGHGPDAEPFTFSYDKLLLATGAAPVIPDMPGFDLDGVLALKSLEDGRRIKNYIRSNHVTRAVIVGMGYIALEMCEAFRTMDIDVAMVKPRPQLLPWMAPKLSGIVREELTNNGAILYDGYPITGIEKTRDGLLSVICGETRLEGHMVLVAIGVKPNSGLAVESGLVLGPQNAIAVDRQMLTSDEDIYAAGDCADAFHVVTGEKTWIPLALRANRAGWAVADHLAGRQVRLEGVAGTAVFKVFGLQVARTGLTVDEAADHGFDPVDVTIETRSRAHAHPGNTTIHVHMVGDRKSGRLLGAQMVGYEGVAHRINAVSVALHQKMSVASYSQCDLAYAPPFGPVWDPTLTAANQLLKKMS